MKVVIDIPEIPKNDKQRWALTNGTPYEERPHGKWIDLGDDMILRLVCSKCGRKDRHLFNFCPNCGASMRKEGEAE